MTSWIHTLQHGDGGRSQFRVAVIHRSSMAESETSHRKAISTLPFQNQEVWDAFCFIINYEKPSTPLILRVQDCASDVIDRKWVKLRNTCISLNNKSAYCVISRSLKRSDTCEWSGWVLWSWKFSFWCLSAIILRASHLQVVSFYNGDSCNICTVFQERLDSVEKFPTHELSVRNSHCLLTRELRGSQVRNSLEIL